MDSRQRLKPEVAEKVAEVKRRARPWRAIISLVIALAAAVAVAWQGVRLGTPEVVCKAGQAPAAGTVCQGFQTAKLITIVGSVVFCVFGLAAVFGFSASARSRFAAAIGSSHASVIRYAIVLVGAIAVLLFTLKLLGVSVASLVVGGALAGVVIGIAGQQALGNIFAGMVLMFARPFVAGDRIWIRSGGLSGTLEGTVIDVSITYVRLETSDGMLLLPNSQVLAAVVGPARQPTTQPVSMAAWQPGNPLAGQRDSPSGSQPGSPAEVEAGGDGQPAGREDVRSGGAAGGQAASRDEARPETAFGGHAGGPGRL